MPTHSASPAPPTAEVEALRSQVASLTVERDRLRRALDAQNHIVQAASVVVVEMDERAVLPPPECSRIDKWLALALHQLGEAVRGLVPETP